MIIGIDAGNSEVKICSQHGVDKFPSDIGEYRERRLTNKLGPNDMIFEHNCV